MPKKVMDYSKCVIYKIVCNDESVTECYVGHTTNFVKRKHSHKNNCNYESQKEHNRKLYQMIRDHKGWDNWTMMPICEYPCENHIQACIKEEECRIELQANLNIYKCFGAETKQKYNKEYRETNKDKINKNKKRKIVCKCGTEICNVDLSRHYKSKKHIKLMELVQIEN